MKAVLQYRASRGFRSRLQQTAPEWLKVVVVDEDDLDTFAREMTDADVLLHVLTPVTAEVLKASPKLKLVQKIGVGVNTIDVATATSLGIAVANMPGTNSQAVAEHTLALMLSVLRRVTYLDAQCRGGNGWGLPPEVYDSVGEIAGRTVGFVGFGAIPQRLAMALTALGANVIYFSHNRVDDGPATHVDSLNALLAQSDIVSLHVPLTQETSEMMHEEAFSVMKAGAILINTARGELVNEDALASALVTGKLAGAGLDVFVSEPVSPESCLFSLSNVVATPHIAWLTPETLERSLGVVVENCRRLREGGRLLNHINPQ